MKEKNRIKFIGGSRIGSVNQTIPFASLIIDEQKLILKNTFSQNLIFHPDDLIDIEEVFFIPFIAQGIKIKHKNQNYNKTVIFWSLTNPQNIIQIIQNKKLLLPVKYDTIKENQFKTKSTSLYKNKFLVFIASLLILLPIGGFMVYRDNNRFGDYMTLEKTSEISLKVNKIWVDHGIAYLNDSIIIPGGTKLVSKQPTWFKVTNHPLFGNRNEIKPSFAELDRPFVINKTAGTFIFRVIKYDDTLLFRIPDPDYKDPYDPTFKDLFDKLFDE